VDGDDFKKIKIKIDLTTTIYDIRSFTWGQYHHLYFTDYTCSLQRIISALV
jgi:hypothetical protein